MVVDVLCNWYSKLYYSVKRNSALSARFAACSGVRQGSCLSPAIFNVFMNIFIKRLKLLGVGCSISSLYIGCILYADDILLLCPSVTGLQDMLDKCSRLPKTCHLNLMLKNVTVLLLSKGVLELTL